MKLIQCITLLLSSLFLAGVSVGADDGARKLASVERQTVAEGAAWAAINALSDGSLGLVIQRARALDEIDAVNASMEWMRSADCGKTWSAPVKIAERRGSGWAAVRSAGRRRLPGVSGTKRGLRAAVQREDRERIFANWITSTIRTAMRSPGPEWPGTTRIRASSTRGPMTMASRGPRRGGWTSRPSVDGRPCTAPTGVLFLLADGTALLSLYGTCDPDYRGPIEIPTGTRVMAGVLRSTG